MKIVVNTRLLRHNQMDGIGWFTYYSMKHIVEQHPNTEFHFLFDSGIDERFLFGENVVPHNLFPPAKHAVLNVVWFEWSVKRILNRIAPDLFFSPDGILCLGWQGKQHGVIHDISFLHRPDDLKWTNNKYYNHFFPKFAKRADRLATISEYSKSDIAASFEVDPGKIDVVYGGGNEIFHPVTDEVKQKVREKYTSGKKYFLFVGTIHPRKNIVNLLLAFDDFKTSSGSDMKLVIAGKAAYKSEEVFAQRDRMKYREDVIFPGRIDDNELNEVTASAFACTFVPFFEGFGLPLIEAMQCDIPVISSNTTCMPEIAGDAALLVDPAHPQAICAAMLRMYAEPFLRSALIEKGRIRRTFFTWKNTADRLWKSIEQTLKS